MSEKEKVIVSAPVSSFSFSDNDFTEVVEDSSKFIEENKTEISKVPNMFPSVGRFVIRVYPDRDKNGKIRYFKRAYIQKLQGIDDTGKEISMRIWQDSSIEEKLISAEKNGLKDAWKYKTQEYLYVMVRLLDCPTSEYYKEGIDVVMILTKFQGLKFCEFFNTLSMDQVKSSLNVSEDYYPIEVIFEKGKTSIPIISSMKFSSEKMKIDSMKLPSGCEWKGLDNVYINESSVITPRRRDMFNKWLMRESGMASGLVDPVEESGFFSSTKQATSPKSPSKDYSNDINASLTGQSTDQQCEIIKNKRNIGEYAGVQFGNPPVDADPDCTMCDNQMQCFSLKNSN